jgi:uncharacterized FlaG/YvyC family protein
MTESVNTIASNSETGINGNNEHHVIKQVLKPPEEVHPHDDLSKEEVDQTVEAIENYIVANERSLNFTVHEATGRIFVKVISEEDGKVIREIPSEEILDHAARMEEIAGLLFDKTV